MTTNAWDNASRLADKHANQGGIFVRLTSNGDKIVGAFCGEPFAREVVWTGERYETYDPSVHTDKRPSLRVMLNFFVPAEGDMKVIEGGTVWLANGRKQTLFNTAWIGPWKRCQRCGKRVSYEASAHFVTIQHGNRIIAATGTGHAGGPLFG